MAIVTASNTTKAGTEIRVIIEITKNSSVKYEVDKETGALTVDRFLSTAMHYPCNYGFVPNTLADDGDPVDVLVHSSQPIIPGATISVRPIGVLLTKDEKGVDHKVIAVPGGKIDPLLEKINSHSDLPRNLINTIEHFFKHYKDLEPSKWVEIIGWNDKNSAYEIIESSIAKFRAGIAEFRQTASSIDS